MAQTKCFVCHLAPSHTQAHFMESCDKLKKHGYKITYNPVDNKTRKDYEQKTALDTADTKKDEDEQKKLMISNLKKTMSSRNRTCLYSGRSCMYCYWERWTTSSHWYRQRYCY